MKLLKIFTLIFLLSTPLMGLAQSFWEARFHKLESTITISESITSGNGDIYFTGYYTPDYVIPDFEMITGKIKNGQVEWTLVNFGGAHFSDEQKGAAITSDNSGNIIVAGTVEDPRTRIILAKLDPNGVMLWNQSFAPMNGTDYHPRDVVADANGNIYVCGDIDYDNYLLLKLNSSGAVLWSIEENIPDSYDRATHLAIDGQNNIYVTGDFDVGGGTCKSKTIKYDAAGNKLWESNYGGNLVFENYSYGLVLDASANAYLLRGDEGNQLNHNIHLYKIDSGGNGLWSVHYDSPFHRSDSPGNFLMGNDGNLYITGRGYDTSSTYHSVVLSMKYDLSGNLIWDRYYPLSVNSGGEYLTFDGSALYIGGYTHSTNGYGALVLKYDGNGNLLWNNQFDARAKGIHNHNGIVTVVSDNYAVENDLYIARYNTDGTSAGATTFAKYRESNAVFKDILTDDDGNIYVTGGDGLDLVTAKYTSTGNLVWQNVLPGKLIGNRITLDDSGNAYVATGTDIEGENSHLVKYNSSGDTVFVKSLGYYSSDARDMVIDVSSDAIYITGRWNIAGSSADAFTTKYSFGGDKLWDLFIGGERIQIGSDGMIYIMRLGSVAKIDAQGSIVFDNGLSGFYSEISSDGCLDSQNNAVLCTTFPSPGYDWFINKINTASGNEVWYQSLDGDGSDNDHAKAITSDNAGNIYVTGNVDLPSTCKIAVAKFSGGGNLIWKKEYDPGIGNNYGTGVDINVDNQGRVWVLGHVPGTLVNLNYEYDFVLLVYDADGNLLREWKYNGPRGLNDSPQKFHFNYDNGSLFIVGASVGISSFYDALLLKLPFDITALSAEDIKQSADIELYPNPNSGLFFIKSNSEQKIESVLIFDSRGKQVFSSEGVNHTPIAINAQNFSNGCYFVKIQTTLKTHFHKIIISSRK